MFMSIPVAAFFHGREPFFWRLIETKWNDMDSQSCPSLSQIILYDQNLFAATHIHIIF